MIENRHLRYFVVVAKMLHMTRAAEKLYIAQPALTQNIQQLEEELGTALLHRNGRTLSLTEAGAVFLVQAERSLQQFEFAKVAAQRAGRGEMGKIAIGFGSTAGLKVVPDLVGRFRQRYPDVVIDFREMGAEALLDSLRGGDIDVAIGYAFPDEEFQSRELAPESLVVVLPQEHPLASADSVCIADLSQETLIIPAHSTAGPLREAILTECARLGFQPRAMQEISTGQTALGLVAAGLGIAILPASIEALSRKNVIMRPIRDAHAFVNLLLLWRRNDESMILRNLLKAI